MISNKTRSNNNKKLVHRRGIIGVESAIVLIAFVIVAAALSFVVLNMGFSTTQKAKTTITSGLQEASSAMEVAGVVTGSGDVANATLKVLAVPIKVASGGASVNLAHDTAAVKYFSKSVTYDNIYKGTISNITVNNLQDAVEEAVNRGYISSNPVNSTAPTDSGAFIYWSTNSNNNDILDSGETAVLVIAYKDTDRPSALDILTTELIVPTGSPLSVSRQVPSITDTVVNMS